MERRGRMSGAENPGGFPKGRRVPNTPKRRASQQANAKKPRPRRRMATVAAREILNDANVRDQVRSFVHRLRTEHWETCAEVLRQVIHDDLRDSRGRMLREPIYVNGSALLDKLGRIRTVRVHMPPKERLAAVQDLFDRTGFARQTTTKLEAGDGLPTLVFERRHFERPSALDAPIVPPAAKAGNGHAHEEAGEIPPPVVH